MKKLWIPMLSLLLVFSVAGCGNNQTNQTEASSPDVEGIVSEATFEPGSGAAEAQPETEAAQPGETKEIEPAPEMDTEAKGVKILVAYFSATNTTEGVAEHIANGLNADLYEIVPKEPYTDADLNYNDNNSRSTIEMNDPSARPAISGSVENMEQYDAVFIGFPSWRHTAPMAVFSFIEE